MEVPPHVVNVLQNNTIKCIVLFLFLFLFTLKNEAECCSSGLLEDSTASCCYNFYRDGNQCKDCPDGYFGFNCSEMCETPSYGLKCALKCECFPCHHIYGCNLATSSREIGQSGERSLSLNCTKTNGYTCIPNEDFTKLLQFCYTDLRIRIQKGMCLFLYRHNSLVDAMSCRTFMKGCPDVSYFSDEIFKYQSCLSIRNGCFLADPVCNSTSETLTTPSTISDRDSLDKKHLMLIWMLTLLVYVIVAILFGGIYLYRKIKVSTKWDASIDYFLQDMRAINHLFTNNKIPQSSTIIEISQNSFVKLPVGNALKLNYNEQENTGGLCIACFREKNCYALHLDKEINCDLTEELEPSPLFVACLNLQIQSVQDFHTKSTPKIKCNENQTNHFCKVGKKQIDKVVCYILKNSTHFRITKGTSSNYPDSSGPDKFDKVIKFLMDNGVDINGCSINGSTLLGIACEHGFGGTAQKLLSCCADVEFCNENGDYPLHFACKNGHSNIVELLLSKNVDINMCNNDAESPLLIGCQNGFESLVKILLDNGANVNLCKVNNISPLYVASHTGHDGIVKLLIENEADVNLCNTNGAGPLSVACQNGHFSIVELLLSKQQDVNVCMKDGRSPLFMACQEGHISCAQLLLNAGADTQSGLRKDVSPLHIACQNGHYSIVKLLLDFGVDIKICMQTKPNPIKIASQKGHDNIVHLLMEHCHIGMGRSTDAPVHHDIHFDDIWIDTFTINTTIPKQTFFYFPKISELQISAIFSPHA